MLILAIESSCDETACAVVENGITELASELASSADLHHATGGIVPEIAARKQAEFIVPVIESTINKTARSLDISAESVRDRIDAIAVTVGPGLAGSLIVGVEAAKALALAWNKPIIPVNHLIGHIYANFIYAEKQTDNRERIPTSRTWGAKLGSQSEKRESVPLNNLFPAVVLIVSGGHTDLVLMRDHGKLEYLGGTTDDAAGEAFDKISRLLGLGMYLGGANLSKVASEYTGPAISERLPRAFINDSSFDFSFSGLKTATKRLMEKNIYSIPAIAKEFEEAVVDVLAEKTLRAVTQTQARSILLGGGVSANQRLRVRLKNEVENNFNSVNLNIPSPKLCTDNAVCIASAAYFNQKYSSFDQILSNPSLTIQDF